MCIYILAYAYYLFWNEIHVISSAFVSGMLLKEEQDFLWHEEGFPWEVSCCSFVITEPTSRILKKFKIFLNWPKMFKICLEKCKTLNRRFNVSLKFRNFKKNNQRNWINRAFILQVFSFFCTSKPKWCEACLRIRLFRRTLNLLFHGKPKIDGRTRGTIKIGPLHHKVKKFQFWYVSIY